VACVADQFGGSDASAGGRRDSRGGGHADRGVPHPVHVLIQFQHGRQRRCGWHPSPIQRQHRQPAECARKHALVSRCKLINQPEPGARRMHCPVQAPGPRYGSAVVLDRSMRRERGGWRPSGAPLIRTDLSKRKSCQVANPAPRLSRGPKRATWVVFSTSAGASSRPDS
jgi:hypothetical protein